MNLFSDNKPYIENEFEMAEYDKSTGLSPEEIKSHILEMYESQKETEPSEILNARAYAFVLDNMQLEINERTPFSIKFNLGIDYRYFASDSLYSALVQKRMQDVLTSNMPTENERRMLSSKIGLADCSNDFPHTVPDWNNVIKYGFQGLLDRAIKKRDRLSSDVPASDKGLIFLDSVIICFEAIIRAMKRIYDYSLKFDVPKFSECIKNLTSAPPKTLYEVMQLQILFLYFEEIDFSRGRSLGQIDRIFLPFFKNDISSGNCTLDEVKELFRYFFIHFTATKRFAQQPMTLGGRDEKGNTFVNELTYIILDVYDDMNIYDPKIHFRYHKGIDTKVTLKILDMIRRGNSSLCIMNDETIFKCYDKMGIPRSDAANYVPLGCYEPIILGKEEAEIGAVWMSLAKILELSLSEGTDPVTGIKFMPSLGDIPKSFEEYFELFIKHLDYCIDFSIANVEEQGKYATLVHPSPIYSATFDSCIDKALDIHENGAFYNNFSVKLFALATAVDSLVVIKKYVFEKKELSYSELCLCIKNNWEGYKTLRAKILRDEDKYGNNNPYADEIMLSVVNHLREKYAYKKLANGRLLRLGTDSISRCISFGKRTGATPDGRCSSEAISKNLRSTDGLDRNGITALANSLLKIDATDFIDSATFDFILHPSAVAGSDGLNAFCGLVTDYFERGGFAMQGNILNTKMLRDAKEHPEQYKTLQIRICGWNEYFVNLSPEMQETFIKQCEAQ